MGWVATVMGVFSAAVPFIIGIALGERPSGIAILGVLTVTVALLLGIRRNEGRQEVGGRPTGDLTDIVDGILAGIFFGCSFVFLGQGASDNPLWPVTMVLAGSIPPLLLLWTLKAPERFGLPNAWGLIAATGVCQGVGFTAFALAVMDGSSLLAFGILCERMTRIQVVGVMVAVSGIVCLVIG